MRRRSAAVAALLPLLLAGAACSKKAAGPVAHDPVPVTVGTVVQKDVPIVIGEIGSVEPYATVAVKAQVGGELTEVTFHEGQDVRRGEMLFRIDARPYEAALKTAQAQLARDDVQLKTARQDTARYAELVKKDYVTQEEYERIRTNADSLEAIVAADHAAVENATVQLEYCTIRSPIDGRTGKLLVNRGNIVKANADTPMVVINQIDPIYVTFSVPQQDLPEIKARRAEGKLEVRATIPDTAAQPPPGTLTFIDNAVDSTTGTVVLKATLPNRDRLLWPGQFVTARLQVAIKPNALLVPTEAIQTGQQGTYIYVVKPDLTVESRPLVASGEYEHETIVEKGVQAGERVVTDGQIRLVPGAAIKIQETAAAGATPSVPAAVASPAPAAAASPAAAEARR